MSSNVEKIAAAMYEESGQFEWVDACDEAKAEMLTYASVAMRDVPGMYWNFDLDSAPRDGTHVILAMPKNKTLRSYWCKPKNDPEHWCMLSHKDEPLAWMPWPEHPFSSQPETATKSGAVPDPGETAAEGNCRAVTGGESAATSFQVSSRANGESGANASKGVAAGETASLYLEDVGSGA